LDGKKRQAPRIGLALGSGAARGWSHIGVIEALEEEGFHIDVVTGASIGALVGAAYAGDRLGALKEWVLSLTWRDVMQIMDLTLSGGGFVQGDRLMSFFEQHVENLPIKSLQKPFGAVATDLERGQEIWFREGALFDAVRASIALPGLFTPVKFEERWLVDGGLVNPVPVSLCRAMGADVVIAVDLNRGIVGKRQRAKQTPVEPAAGENDGSELRLRETGSWDQFAQQLKTNLSARLETLPVQLGIIKPESPGLIDVVMGSINIMQDRITRSRMAGDPPDVSLAPRLAELGMMEFHRAEEAIEEGRRCVKRMAPALHYAFE